MEYQKSLLFAVISMAIAISLGAMGAHYLKETLHLSAERLANWHTAVFYQIVHALAILVIVMLSKQINIKISKSIVLFIVGTCLFSGSIYLITLNSIWEMDWLKYSMIPATPLGGICFIFGWVLLTINLFKQNSSS